MKKYFVPGLLILCAVLLAACQKQSAFTKMQDEIDTTYQKGDIVVKIARNVKDEEKIFASIEKDIETLEKFRPIDSMTIIVSEKYLKASDSSGINCKADHVGTEGFKKMMIGTAYRLYDNWKVEGLYGNIFCGEGTQNAGCEQTDLSTYYKTHTFSLFGARFIPAFSDEEYIKNLQSASTGLVKYFLDRGEKDRLLTESISLEEIRPWAKENQIDLAYLETIYDHVNDIKVSDIRPIEKLIIDTKRDVGGFSIRIASLHEDYDEAQDLEQVIKGFDEAIEKNLAAIKREAPNFYKDYEKALTQPPKVRYIFNQGENINYQMTDMWEITLHDLASHMAEYNHFLMGDSFNANGVHVGKPMWVTEGVDHYPFYMYSDGYIQETKEWLLPALKKYRDPSGSYQKQMKDRKIHLIVMEVFDANFPNALTDDSIWTNEEDLRKMIHILHAYAVAYRKEAHLTSVHPSDTVSGRRPIQGDPGISAPEDLGYMANFSFVAYLIQEYGWEKMLYFTVEDFTKITFEEYFGKSYKELEAGWKEYILKDIKKGELLLYRSE
ncbi:MAG: hypothetical protein Q4A75_01765 [Peptostreptococcaceae bacterium]|nr:hypothetical protein [Peptostreptococcaceae bacterium]